MIRIKIIFTCSLILSAMPILVSAAAAQSGRKLPPSTQQNQDDTVRLRAEEVLLNITVTDPYLRQATDLRKTEFIIAEDGQRQDISSFFISAVPVNVVLMLDASGSVYRGGSSPEWSGRRKGTRSPAPRLFMTRSF
jgi:hypothetical protein